MQVLLLAVAVPLALAPLWTHQLYQVGYDWEKGQIELDNLGIALGRLDESTMNDLVKVNRQLRNLERIHHPLHLCARADPTAECAIEDQIIESQMSWLIESARMRAQWRWRTNLANATTKSKFSQTMLCIHRRETGLALSKKQCGLCGINNELALMRKPKKTYLKSCAFADSSYPIEVGVQLKGSRLNRNWQYRLTTR